MAAMKVINVHDAKSQFSNLVERASAGEEMREPKCPKRKAGAWKGKVWISANFDKVDKEIEALFDRGAIWPYASRLK